MIVRWPGKPVGSDPASWNESRSASGDRPGRCCEDLLLYDTTSLFSLRLSMPSAWTRSAWSLFRGVNVFTRNWGSVCRPGSFVDLLPRNRWWIQWAFIINYVMMSDSFKFQEVHQWHNIVKQWCSSQSVYRLSFNKTCFLSRRVSFSLLYRLTCCFLRWKITTYTQKYPPYSRTQSSTFCLLLSLCFSSAPRSLCCRRHTEQFYSSAVDEVPEFCSNTFKSSPRGQTPPSVLSLSPPFDFSHISANRS